jgi:hypothetical protein
MKVKVRSNTQVVHEGQVFDGGTLVEVPADVGQHWLAEGWVTEVKPPTPKGTRK